MNKEIAQENIIRALKDEPGIKLCIDCKHYKWEVLTTDVCTRDFRFDFNPVRGKKELQGEKKICAIERETMSTYPSLVESGSVCGAIGQHWEKRKQKQRWARWLQI